MIAFIANPEKINILPKEIIKDTPYELISKVDDINLVVAKIKNATHYSQIIIDISIFENTDEEIVKALYLLKSLSATNIIIIAQGLTLDNYLLNELIKIGIYNFVLSWTQENVEDEIIACFKGKKLEDLEQHLTAPLKEKKSLFVFNGKKHKDIKIIQVIGISSRIGTTTQAIRITKSLIANSNKACYIECNNSGHLKMINDVFTETKPLNENTILFSNIPMCFEMTSELNSMYEYIVCDYGFIPLDKLDINNKTIIVAGSKAWEMIQIPYYLETSKDFKDISFIFSFTDEKDKEDILDFMGDNWTNTLFADYSPDMFSSLTDNEKSLYKKLIFNNTDSTFKLIKWKGSQKL